MGALWSHQPNKSIKPQSFQIHVNVAETLTINFDSIEDVTCGNLVIEVFGK